MCDVGGGVGACERVRDNGRASRGGASKKIKNEQGRRKNVCVCEREMTETRKLWLKVVKRVYKGGARKGDWQTDLIRRGNKKMTELE